MDPDLASEFLKGTGLGIAVAAPVGPIGVLCIRRTLADGLTIGLLTGLGAAVADATYAAVAAFGMLAVAHFLVDHAQLLRVGGGLFLLFLAWRTWQTAGRRLADGAQPTQRMGRVPAFATGVGLTLANPLTILSFATIFAGLGLATVNPAPHLAAALVAGVGIGSAVWWLGLTAAIAATGRYMGPSLALAIDRIAALALLAFAAWALIGANAAGG